jgi:methyl-accepting chemotaxis protein
MKNTFLSLPTSILAKRLIWKIFLFALMLMALSLLVTAFATWLHEKKDLEEQFHDIQEGYLDIIRTALWVDDKENLQIISMGISRLPGIKSARIYHKGSTALEAHRKETHVTLSRIVPIFHTYDGRTYELGELHLEENPEYVRQKIVKEVLGIATSQSAIILVVCVFLFFLVYRLVIKRLVAVTEYTASLSTDSLGKPFLMAQENQPHDELDELTTVINEMQKDLYYAFEHQKSLEERLRKHKEGLEKTVAQRTLSLSTTNKRLQLEIHERKKIEEEREKLIVELQNALDEVRKLSGLLPICANCKKIRDDKGYWNLLESYISQHSEAVFTHSICPDCVKKLYPDIGSR